MVPEAYLGSGASQVRTEHDNPGRSVREFLPAGLETIFEKFDITTTTVSALLVFDLVLNH